jgi:transcriptional regulator with XRE-family HTH domain
MKATNGHRPVGERIRRARMAKGYSLRKLHDLSGVAIGAIHRLETGKTADPLGQTLYRICPHLDLDPDEMIDVIEATA